MASTRRCQIAALFFLSSLCPLCLCGETRAALDPERTTPYQLKVVLHLGESRLLTDVFGERVERGLHDYLQASFGSLASVEVVRMHPKLDEVLEKGLQRTLDNWKERSAVKTHFVLIDYVNGHYEIQSRQHDGLTGQPSPIVRTGRTRDRAFAARQAAFMVEKDFGIMGTFDSWSVAAGATVMMQLKGSGMGAPMSRWVQKGDVFKVVAVPRDANRGPVEIAWAVLRVVEPPQEDGSCKCQIFRRYELRDANVSGFRCFKIATVQDSLRMRVTQTSAEGGAARAPTGMRVEVRRNGFQETSPLQDNLDASGSFDSSKSKFGEKGVFDQLALVTLLNGPTPRAQFPVALVDEQPVLVVLEPTTDDTGLQAIRRTTWKGWVADSYLVHTSLFNELQRNAAKADLREATIQRAREGIARTRKDHDWLRDMRDEMLKAVPAADREKESKFLVGEDRLLASMEKGEKTLQEFIAKQEENLKAEKDPARLALLGEVERGKLLEEKAEYGEALRIYDEVSKNDIKIAKVKERADQIRKQFEPKSKEHERAQVFIFKTFPGLDTAGLHAELKNAKEHLETCHSAGDGLSPHRLLLGIQSHIARLRKEAETLNTVNQDDLGKLQTIDNVNKELVMLAEKAQNYIKPLGSEK